MNKRTEFELNSTHHLGSLVDAEFHVVTSAAKICHDKLAITFPS